MTSSGSTKGLEVSEIQIFEKPTIVLHTYLGIDKCFYFLLLTFYRLGQKICKKKFLFWSI